MIWCAAAVADARCSVDALVPIASCMVPAAPHPARHLAVLLPPARMTRCSVAARCCVGALVPLLRAWYLPLFPCPPSW